MHESIIIPLNIIIIGYVFKYICRLKFNLSIYLFSSFVFVWIIFLNVNPYEINQNKFSILSNISSEYLPKMSMLKDTNIDKLNYPVIFKPIICSRNGYGVKLINNIDEAVAYIENNNINETMVQDFIPYKNEVGILYEKNIISMVVKKSKDSTIIASCLGKNACDDITYLKTHKLNEVIRKISNQIPNFYVGRYDIKYKDLDSLLEGKDFYILEVNGTAGFDLRKFTLQYFGLSCIYYIERWVLYRLFQGFKNIITLRGYNPIKLIQVMALTVYNTIYCKDWEKILSMYS